MKPRMNFYQAAPDTIKALSGLEAQIAGSGLEKSLIELVKTRASQINGCAFCINMHTQDARKQGETEQRLYLLNAWRESPLYTDRERAALARTEALTLIAETHAPDDLYAAVRAHFNEAETVNLTMLIGAINAWNRLAIAFRAVHPVKLAATSASAMTKNATPTSARTASLVPTAAFPAAVAPTVDPGSSTGSRRSGASAAAAERVKPGGL